ncbi:pyrroloquinoline quinone biosynthesis peptide chaperone PqqD [Streptomyces fructofermentans]|uniref:pyrroloquinoline quinone biosynthesis peptide chaperone PqqD n=1 Tax=Streptomyces fructofermentans TaxID=152141 RepID=UPI003405D150
MSADRTWRPRVAASAVLRRDHVRRSDVLLLPERVVVLHGSGRAVLDLCDGSRTVEEITAALGRAHSGPVAADDVASFLGRLRTQGCLR